MGVLKDLNFQFFELPKGMQTDCKAEVPGKCTRNR